MKKPKMQLDAKSIQALLIQNVEKIALGLVGLLGLFMVYKATTVDRYQRTPDELIKNVRRGEDSIANTDLKVALTAKDYVALAQQSRQPIADRPYLTTTYWDAPKFDKRKLRERPKVFAVQNVRGQAEVGAVNMATQAQAKTTTGAATAITSEVRLQRWIVLTGLVPIEMQEDAYTEALRKSVHFSATSDYPIYDDYLVQRIELPDGEDPAELDWKKATRFTFRAEVRKRTAQWAQSGTSDVVPTDCIDEALTFPLAPLVGSKWGKSAAHPKEIPVVDPDAKSGRVEAADSHSSDGVGKPAAQPGTPGAGIGGKRAAPGTRRHGRGDTRSAYDDPAAAKAPTSTQEAAEAKDEPKAAAFWLLRFFDYTVEPGKRYVYRFRLALVNPNYIPPSGSTGGLRLSHLKDSAEAKNPWIETEWSEPTSVISTPPNAQTLAVAVSQGREPAARVVVAKWVERGFQAFHEFTVIRGQFIEFAGTTFTHAAKKYDVDYHSGAIALDFRGGDRVGRSRLTTPGEVLLFQPNGDLTVSNESEDKSVIDQLKADAATHAQPAGSSAKSPTATPKPSSGLRGLGDSGPRTPRTRSRAR